MKIFGRVLKYVIPYWPFAALNIVFNMLAALFSLFSLSMIAPFLELLFSITEPVDVLLPWSADHEVLINNFYYYLSLIIREYGQVTGLYFISAAFVIFAFIGNACRFLGMFFMANVRNGVVRDIRKDLYYQLLILPLSYYSDKKQGDILSRMTSDVFEVEWSIMNSLLMVFREPFTISIYMFSLFMISTKLTLTALLILPLAVFIIGRAGKSLKKKSDEGQRQMGQLVSIFEESLSGLRIIKAFSAIQMMLERFVKLNFNYTRLMMKIYRRRDLAAPLSEFLGTVVLVIVLWIGGRMVLEESVGIQPNVLILFVVIFARMVSPAQSFATASYAIQRGIASASRIFNILDEGEVITENENAAPKTDFTDNIEFVNLGFAYDHKDVLININLKIEKGKLIALVGPSGSGKSTLVNLLPRFYDATKGVLLFDNKPIGEYIIKDIRALMGIVSQETVLFNDSVHNNIAFGLDDIFREEVIEAARIANAHDFISAMKKGYDTNIGDRGVKLSGGQKQRISIARAVLRNPPILILDEATSSLDTESEKLVQEALNRIMENRTAVVIAHRLSTIKKADEIIVLDKGRILERGKHEMLIAQDGLYKKLYEMQSLK